MRTAATAVVDAGVDAWASERLGAARAERLRHLAADPGVPAFFGRTDTAEETFHIGRRHVRDAAGDPVVIDWRAPMSRPFYQASAVEPQGLVRRRRFGFAAGELTGYEDEPLGGRGRAREPVPAGGDRAPAQRPHARHRRHHPARPGRHRAGPAGRVDLRAGRARHRQDGGRPAPGGLPALHARRAAGPLRRPRRRPQPGVPALHRGGPADPRRGRGGPDDGRRADRPGAGPRGGPARGRRPQGRRPDGRRAAPRAVGRDRQAHRLDPGAAGRPEVPGDRSSGSSATWTTSAAAAGPTTTSSCCTTRPAGNGWRCWSPRTPAGRRRRPAAARATPRPARRPAAPRCARSATRCGRPARPPAWSTTCGADPARLARAARGVLDRRRAGAAALAAPPGRCAPRPGPTPTPSWSTRWPGCSTAPPATGTSSLDEAQDLSPMQCRAVARRLAAGSLTVLGDLAQATSPWSPSDWQETLAGPGPPGHRRPPADPRLPRAGRGAGLREPAAPADRARAARRARRSAPSRAR